MGAAGAREHGGRRWSRESGGWEAYGVELDTWIRAAREGGRFQWGRGSTMTYMHLADLASKVPSRSTEYD